MQLLFQYNNGQIRQFQIMNGRVETVCILKYYLCDEVLQKKSRRRLKIKR